MVQILELFGGIGSPKRGVEKEAGGSKGKGGKRK